MVISNHTTNQKAIINHAIERVNAANIAYRISDEDSNLIELFRALDNLYVYMNAYNLSFGDLILETIYLQTAAGEIEVNIYGFL